VIKETNPVQTVYDMVSNFLLFTGKPIHLLALCGFCDVCEAQRTRSGQCPYSANLKGLGNSALDMLRLKICVGAGAIIGAAIFKILALIWSRGFIYISK